MMGWSVVNTVVTIPCNSQDIVYFAWNKTIFGPTGTVHLLLIRAKKNIFFTKDNYLNIFVGHVYLKTLLCKANLTQMLVVSMTIK